MILRDVCGASFTLNKNLLRPVRTGHQGMKRTDNEKRKRDVTDKARKQGLLKQSQVGPFGSQVTRLESREPSHVPILVQAQVESVPQLRSRAPWGARSGDAGLPGCPLKRRSRS